MGRGCCARSTDVRAGQEAGPIEGTGIGLTISKRLAEIMCASVGFQSEVDRGSAFWIELPIHREQAASVTSANEGPASLSRLDELTETLEQLLEDR